jgi:hypothetical protein
MRNINEHHSPLDEFHISENEGYGVFVNAHSQHSVGIHKPEAGRVDSKLAKYWRRDQY